MQKLAISADLICIARTQVQQLTLPSLLTSDKKSTDTLIKETQQMISDKGRFVYQEKSEHCQLLAIWVHKVCNAMIFSKSVLNEQRYSAGRNSLIETLIAESEKVSLEGI